RRHVGQRGDSVADVGDVLLGVLELTRFAAALTEVAVVEGARGVPPFGHRCRVGAGRLLFDRRERSGDDRDTFGRTIGDIEVCHDRDVLAVESEGLLVHGVSSSMWSMSVSWGSSSSGLNGLRASAWLGVVSARGLT